MVYNSIQRLCFIALFTFPFLTSIDSYRPDVNSNFSLDVLFPENQNHEIVPQSDNYSSSSFLTFDNVEHIISILFLIYIIYLLYKRRLNIQEMIFHIAQRFPRLTPLLFIVSLVHRIVSHNDDIELNSVHQDPELIRSSISLELPTPSNVELSTIIITPERDAILDSSQDVVSVSQDEDEWHDCSSHLLTEVEERTSIAESAQSYMLVDERTIESEDSGEEIV